MIQLENVVKKIPKNPKTPHDIGAAWLRAEGRWRMRLIEAIDARAGGKPMPTQIREFKVWTTGAGYTVMVKALKDGDYRVAFKTVDTMAKIPGILTDVMDDLVEMKGDKYPPNQE